VDTPFTIWGNRFVDRLNCKSIVWTCVIRSIFRSHTGQISLVILPHPRFQDDGAPYRLMKCTGTVPDPVRISMLLGLKRKWGCGRDRGALLIKTDVLRGPHRILGSLMACAGSVFVQNSISVTDKSGYPVSNGIRVSNYSQWRRRRPRSLQPRWRRAG